MKTAVHGKGRHLSPRQQAAVLLAEGYARYLSFVSCDAADLTQISQDPPPLQNPPVASRKRKRSEAADHQTQEQPLPKRTQGSRASDTADVEITKDVVEQLDNTCPDPVQYWTQTKRWPKGYFEQDSQVREDLERDSWPEEQMAESNHVVQYVEINGFRYPQPIRKVPNSLRRKQLNSSLTSSDDQTNREAKSTPYQNTRYAILLAAKGSYMEKSVSGITDTSRTWCKTLLNSEETVPIESLFGMIFSKKHVSKYRIETKLKLFEISLV